MAVVTTTNTLMSVDGNEYTMPIDVTDPSNMLPTDLGPFVQQLQRKLNLLTTEVAKLKAENTEVRARLNALGADCTALDILIATRVAVTVTTERT